MSEVVTAEQIIRFVRSQGGATTAQVGAHFNLRPNNAASRLSKLAMYGRLEKRRQPRNGDSNCERAYMALWTHP